MKNTKLLVLALLVALLACLALTATAEHDHIWVEQTEMYQAPGCETQGWRMYRCSVAGCAETRIDYIAPAGHKWGEYVQVKPATCGAAGIQQQVCTVCGHYNVNAILNTPAATGEHTWVKVHDGKERTCTEDGVKPLYKCSVCGAVDPSRNGSTVPKTGHSVAGSPWYVIREANCLQEGIIGQDCFICGAQINTKTTPKNGKHPSWITILPAKKATCTEPGCCDIQQCPLCGAYNSAVDLSAYGNYHDGRSVPATGHKWKILGTVAPTCTQKGYTATECERCGHKQQIDIPATGHSATWIVKDASNSPTSVIWGLKCALCNNWLATQIVYAGEKAPSGSVNTGKAKVDANYSANVGTVKETAKKTTTTKKATTTAKKTTTTTTATKAPAAVVATAPVEGTKLVEGLNLIDGKAVVVAKEGKATLVYAEDGYTVKLADAELVVGEAVAYTADDLAVVAEAPAATASK